MKNLDRYLLKVAKGEKTQNILKYKVSCIIAPDYTERAQYCGGHPGTSQDPFVVRFYFELLTIDIWAR